MQYAALSCRDETYDPGAALRALIPGPAATLSLGAAVAAATGAGWLAVKALHARGMLSGRSTLRR